MDQQIARRFYEYRKKSGLSQEELAARLGISRQSVSKWERGESSPDTTNLIRLAKLYGVSLDDLVNGIAPETADGSDEPLQEEFSTQPQVEEAEQPLQEETEQEKEAPSAPPSGETKSKENIHISWKDGIHVEREDSTVHVSWKDGVHVEDEEDSVHIGPGGITIDDATVQKYADCHHKKKKRDIPSGGIAIVATIAFLYLGFVHGAWHPAWLLFLLIPVVEGLADAICKRKFTVFPFPVLAALTFLCLGFFWGLWHPGWLVFLLIPIYYPIANWLDREINGED